MTALELRDRADAARNRIGSGEPRVHGSGGDLEIMQIERMFVALSDPVVDPNTGLRTKFAWHAREHHDYTCLNFDARRGQCTAYETRPLMCVNYPDTGSCHYRDCTLKTTLNNKVKTMPEIEMMKKADNEAAAERKTIKATVRVEVELAPEVFDGDAARALASLRHLFTNALAVMKDPPEPPNVIGSFEPTPQLKPLQPFLKLEVDRIDLESDVHRVILSKKDSDLMTGVSKRLGG